MFLFCVIQASPVRIGASGIAADNRNGRAVKCDSPGNCTYTKPKCYYDHTGKYFCTGK